MGLLAVGPGARLLGHPPLHHIACFLAVLAAFVLGTASECEPNRSCCHLQRCWNLYESSRDQLGIRDDLFGERVHRPSPDYLRLKCITLRTFNSCINMTRDRGCLGDLSFHSAHKGAESQMKQYNCSLIGPVYTPDPNNRPSRRPCSYDGRPEHRQCGLFGDPHLRTFTEEFFTCRVQGAWPLLNNEYLTVQVTNDPVGIQHPTATATSKLTVVVKRHDECADSHYVTYQAQTDHLPDAFDDGRTHFGKDRSVEIRAMSPGRHVEIYLRYIDTTLIVRQIGHYFTFAAKMPEEIVNRSLEQDPTALQLCARGCPPSERIDYKDFLAQKRSRLKDSLDQHAVQGDIAMSREAAVERCRRASVVDFYFDSCVFDLMMTGDANFTIAASSALQDLLQLNPESARRHMNRTSLEPPDEEYANSAHAWQTMDTQLRLIVLLIALSSLLCCS